MWQCFPQTMHSSQKTQIIPRLEKLALVPKEMDNIEIAQCYEVLLVRATGLHIGIAVLVTGFQEVLPIVSLWFGIPEHRTTC